MHLPSAYSTLPSKEKKEDFGRACLTRIDETEGVWEDVAKRGMSSFKTISQSQPTRRFRKRENIQKPQRQHHDKSSAKEGRWHKIAAPVRQDREATRICSSEPGQRGQYCDTDILSLARHMSNHGLQRQ